ncbi:MAG: di-trans,poly-cis-decaprenylcistransferase [Rickettsiales bacterium]|nr:di-trans,poly-cis-decaprenylcistransferase [Rickettsiales bacterium]|tara:strand:- start:303 stop:986 length:684 start_codon:yes stop_codon:yes gene_type:complete
MSIPKHIAIIMDGNGRWATRHGTSRKAGHQQGSEALRNLLENSRELGVEVFTVYAFSSENWQRSPEEVSDLMDLLRYYLRHEIKKLHKDGVKVCFIGDRTALSSDLQTELEKAELLTENNQALTLVVALSYGSRQELVRAMNKIDGEITVDAVCNALDTANWPEPDLLIRTGGEKRLSNFLLWQCAYTELYFTETLWPDFTIEHLHEALADYAQRERRFGSRPGLAA